MPRRELEAGSALGLRIGELRELEQDIHDSLARLRAGRVDRHARRYDAIAAS
jgi:hypothetical protein